MRGAEEIERMRKRKTGSTMCSDFERTGIYPNRGISRKTQTMEHWRLPTPPSQFPLPAEQNTLGNRNRNTDNTYTKLSQTSYKSRLRWVTRQCPSKKAIELFSSKFSLTIGMFCESKNSEFATLLPHSHTRSFGADPDFFPVGTPQDEFKINMENDTPRY